MMRGTQEMPTGLGFCLTAIDQALESEVLDAIGEYQLEPMVLHDNPSRRKVAHFGASYAPSSRTVSLGQPIPGVLMRAVNVAAHALELADVAFREVLLSDYPPGSGIGRHRDAPAFGLVLGVSLLSPCTLQFEQGSGSARKVWEQFLPPRSAYVLTGDARWKWRHGISAVRHRRVSITARELRVDLGPA